MKKQFWIIVIVFIFSAFLFTAMFCYSTKDSNVKNGFNRTPIISNIQLTAKTTLDPNTYSIVDLNDDKIILRTSPPHKIVFLSYNLKSSIKKTLPFPANKDSMGGVNTLKFYKSSIYLLNGKTAMVYKIDKNNKRISSNKLDSIPFNHAAIINDNAFVITRKMKYNNENRRGLKKINWHGQEQGMYFPEKQTDGYFDNDGQFKYDEKTKRLIFMFFYRGEFACLDTNLKQLYIAKTIDTVRHSNIEAATSKVTNAGVVLEKMTLSKPAKTISRRVCLSGNHIYINSYLKADNDSIEQFANSEIIDIYQLSDGKYVTSFYIPKIEKKKLTDFMIYKKNLVALYNNILVVFSLPDLGLTETIM